MQMIDHPHTSIPGIIDIPDVRKVTDLFCALRGFHGDVIVEQKIGAHPPHQLQFKGAVYHCVPDVQRKFQVVEVLAYPLVGGDGGGVCLICNFQRIAVPVKLVVVDIDVPRIGYDVPDGIADRFPASPVRGPIQGSELHGSIKYPDSGCPDGNPHFIEENA